MLSISFITLALCALVSARQHPARLRRQAGIDASRIPEFGIKAGDQPMGTGECVCARSEKLD